MTQYIRFVHIQDLEHKKFHGATVAYIRTDNEVFFAVTYCLKSDPYQKSIGREFSSFHLNTHIEDFPSDRDLVISTCGTLGMFKLSTLISEVGVSEYLADHFVASMTMMDFKHSTISGYLRKLVYHIAQA